MLVQPSDSPLTYLHVAKERETKVITGCEKNDIDIVGDCSIGKLDALGRRVETRDGRLNLDMRVSERYVAEAGQWFAQGRNDRMVRYGPDFVQGIKCRDRAANHNDILFRVS